MVSVLAGCHATKAGPAGPDPVATVGRQYMAAIGPADSALTSFRQQALSSGAAAPGRLISAIPPTRGALKRATGSLLAIQAPAPLGGDIKDVVAAARVVDGDLVAFRTGPTVNIEGQIAKVVADIGRESAADSVVRFTLQLLASTGNPPNQATAMEH